VQLALFAATPDLALRSANNGFVMLSSALVALDLEPTGPRR